MGLATYENMRSLDYLCSREDVNAERVACMGVCWSGIQCYMLTALDERIKVACAVCGMAPQGTLPTDFAFAQGHMCIGTFLPGFLTAAGIQDLLALIAPRPLQVQNNVSDECYPVLCFRRSKAETEMVYRTMGHPEMFDAHVDTSVRDLTPEFVDRAVEWLKAYL
jgi:dienelactone hydrolase